MIQKVKATVSPLATALSELTAMAIPSGFPQENKENKRPSIKNKGAPGGWTTCKVYEAEINSPQSQRGTEGSRVSM